MNSTATPESVRRRICVKSSDASCADSAAVGSSMIRTRTSSDRALAISTACCDATVRLLASVRTSRRTSILAKMASASLYIRRQRTSAPRSWWLMKMFSATLRSGKIAGSW